MLTKVLSISGKPGLYKLISTTKNLNIVESLLDGKRVPVYLTEKVVALSDVSIYTTEEDVPLREVFRKIKEKENGEKTTLGSKSSNAEVFRYFGEVLPNYDTEKVYASDIKKILSWYNILIGNGIDFEKVEAKTEEPAGNEPENNEK
ncbi:DUF5606 family protein [Petrimonas mucosa]|jgi:hypothetical protein|uniref:Uncharacterized protein n=1 Tax=Petrimonas mucosa TaxID=1642646 RepID=A0A1G4G6Z4_9BACT|nr:DUF5606 domain-containing protein [Petrimonas mucosa]SCM57730.1 putative protein {ECO:0000313/EMBL:CEA15996,1} [Petrimonas mucosa]SFU48713.1 hypothetical protein SAMN05216364_10178 [Porphyromonadaceae bacterium KHP3R9]